MASKSPKKDTKPLSKTEILNQLAESTELTKKQVADVLDALNGLIEQSVSKKGPGSFSMPGLFKISVTRKEATKASKRPNPFKPGEMMDVKAKPAHNVVKIRPLKALRDMV